MSRRWPAFDENGDLPAGIHQAKLAEVVAHFGTLTVRRRVVAQRLQRIYRLAQSTGSLARFVVFGSFVTAKPAPNDVDIFMVMEDAFDSNRLTGDMADVFDHQIAQDAEGASVFWIRRMAVIDSEEAALEYWQNKRDHTRRGIVEVTGDDSE
jgi:hypothetical protein